MAFVYLIFGQGLITLVSIMLTHNFLQQVNALCWLLATGIGIAVIYGLDFSRALTQKPYPIVSSAFYGGFHRLAWGVALGWVVFACSRGYGGKNLLLFENMMTFENNLKLRLGQ